MPRSYQKKTQGHYMKSLLLGLALLFSLQAESQQMRELSQSVQDRIARFEELVEFYTRVEDFQLVVSYLNQISYTYWENNRADLAVNTFYRAIPIYEKLGDLENVSKIHTNIGLIYLDLENVLQAERAFTNNLRIQRQIGDPQGITTALVDLAYVKNLRNDHREAIVLLEEAIQIALDINYESVLPNVYRQLSNSYTNIGNVRQGEEFRQKYTDTRDHISRQTMRGEFQEREEQSQVEALRSQAEARARKAEMELQEVVFRQEQDSIRLIVRQREDSLELAQLRAERQTLRLERQMREIERMEQEAELTEAEIERQQAVQRFQQLVIYSTLGGLIMVFVLVFLMYRSNKAKQKANRELASKNQQIQLAREKLQEAFEKIEDQNFRITQSISYAREIQRALFPPVENLQNYLPESFIFFKPVDMVSGDFYWFREGAFNPVAAPVLAEEAKIQTAKGNGSWLPFEGDKFILTAVDCTGHGVPGAFMSMIGYNLLDSITQGGTTHPDRILGKLHNGVRTALKQDETTNRDGMDISMCVINKSTRTVEFAGANNPVIYISNGEFNLIKGDMMSIGGSKKKIDRRYKAHSIKVTEPTCFYILTDGYTDQFGGEDRRKYSMKNLKELLMEIHHKPMHEQRKLLDENFQSWKGKEDQIDDVLIIGFRL